jgi:penicillin amidase
MTDWRARATALLALVVLLGAAVGGGQFLALAAPYSGTAFDTVDRADRPVETPYGDATVRYDDDGVPHVQADNEQALYFAVGYVQARDRLFQMDIQRRIMNGTLAEVAGSRAVDSDRFHRRMGFEDAARASWRQMRGTEHGAKIAAYSAGVNTYMDRGPLPLEFRLNDYEPRRWTPVATLLVGQQISWQLSGEFSDLRGATIQRRLPEATSLYPDRLPHDEPVLANWSADRPGATVPRGNPDTPGAASRRRIDQANDTRTRALYESLRAFERQRGIGSNNWIVGGEQTASGEPLLANDPHLALTAPPIWYEMHLESEGVNVTGVTFPGIPMVILGQTEALSWGVTNVGADVTDVYRYRWRDGAYYYEGAWREPNTTEETIGVADGPDRTLTVRRTVHGPVVQRERQRVAVAWVGLTATTQSRTFDRLAHADTIDDAESALREYDLPAQNFVVAGKAGGTLYYPAGEYPIRTVDGERVAGDRVFNGSAGHGEWGGFTPYGNSTWTGFVPGAAVPRARNVSALGTANQRVADDPGFYLGTARHFAAGYRGERLNERLRQSVEAEDPVTATDMKELQRDTHSAAADAFVPYALAGRAEMGPEARRLADVLDEWDHNMTADSRAALVFSRWLEHFRNETFADEYGANGLDEGYYPSLRQLEALPADSRWYDDQSTMARETRGDIAARAMAETAAELDREGWTTYGDYHVADVNHPFGLDWLGYPERPIDGSPYTLSNYRVNEGTDRGSSWRLVAGSEGSWNVVPGGNQGSSFSPAYRNQYDRWRTGRYKRVTWQPPATGPDIVFEEASP